MAASVRCYRDFTISSNGTRHIESNCIFNKDTNIKSNMKPVRDKIIDNYEWYSSIKNEPIWGKAWNQVFDLIYNQINIEVKSRILDKIRGI